MVQFTEAPWVKVRYYRHSIYNYDLQATFNSDVMNSNNKVELTYNDILSSNGLNSVTFSNPYAKLCFTTMIAKSIILKGAPPLELDQNNRNKKIIYIDTDTQFTAYLKAGLVLRQEIEEKQEEKIMNNRKVLGIPDSSPVTNRGKVNDCNSTGYDHEVKDSDTIDNNTVSYNNKYGLRLIDIYLPSEGRFDSMLGGVISSMPEASIVIFDSLNSFYNIYPTRIFPESEQSGRQRRTIRQSEMEVSERGNQGDGQPSSITDRLSQTEATLNESKVGYTIGRLNHLLSIFIMLLVKHGVYHNIPVLVTSMIRYKKVAEGSWTKSPACRRLLNQKSVVRLSVEMSNEKDLSVNVMKHPLIGQQTIVLADAGIYSAFEIDQT